MNGTQKITKSISAAAKLMISRFVVLLICLLAVTTVKMELYLCIHSSDAEFKHPDKKYSKDIRVIYRVTYQL